MDERLTRSMTAGRDVEAFVMAGDAGRTSAMPAARGTESPVIPRSQKPSACHVACLNCRGAHRKCDGLLPCAPCQQFGLCGTCSYVPPGRKGRKPNGARRKAKPKKGRRRQRRQAAAAAERARKSANLSGATPPANDDAREKPLTTFSDRPLPTGPSLLWPGPADSLEEIVPALDDELTEFVSHTSRRSSDTNLADEIPPSTDGDSPPLPFSRTSALSSPPAQLAPQYSDFAAPYVTAAGDCGVGQPALQSFPGFVPHWHVVRNRSDERHSAWLAAMETEWACHAPPLTPPPSRRMSASLDGKARQSQLWVSHATASSSMAIFGYDSFVDGRDTTVVNSTLHVRERPNGSGFSARDEVTALLDTCGVRLR
eukprot:Opistho-1_new@40190